MRSILDGASKTSLAGEKHVDSVHYTTGESLGDNESLYAGYCTDLHRFAGAVESLAISVPPFAEPVSDNSNLINGIQASTRFGSAHPNGLNMLYCDGAIQFVGFDVDPEVHLRSGHRYDEGRPLKSLFRIN
jgi:prepilin-type processing-associated H-X9-DG protein